MNYNTRGRIYFAAEKSLLLQHSRKNILRDREICFSMRSAYWWMRRTTSWFGVSGESYQAVGWDVRRYNERLTAYKTTTASAVIAVELDGTWYLIGLCKTETKLNKLSREGWGRKSEWPTKSTALGTLFRQWWYLCLGVTAQFSIIIAQYNEPVACKWGRNVFAVKLVPPK